jgi:alpha-1,2-mannosyltransferase
MRLEILCEAQWFDARRAIGYAWIFLILSIVAAIAWVVMSPNLIDPEGKPLGTDFMNVWSAGRLALDGDPAAAYDYARQYAVQRDALPYPPGAVAPYYGWPYPPLFMIPAALLAFLPYGAALAAWMAVTLPLYLATVRKILPSRHAILFALAFPAVLLNFGHGQNGFLTAALLGTGVLLLERREWLAGAVIGLLAYKPQFGLLMPLALIAGGYWRAVLGAIVSVVAVSAVSYVVFGEETWRAFFDSLRLTQSIVLEEGSTGWQKIQSAFSAVRMWGGGVTLAYVVQGGISLIAAALVIWTWRKPIGIPMKGAMLATASLAATPYVMDYDLIVLALPMAWLAAEGMRDGFRSWEKFALAAIWLLPLLSRSIGTLGVPFAPFILMGLLALIVRRAVSDVPVVAADTHAAASATALHASSASQLK